MKLFNKQKQKQRGSSSSVGKKNVEDVHAISSYTTHTSSTLKSSTVPRSVSSASSDLTPEPDLVKPESSSRKSNTSGTSSDNINNNSNSKHGDDAYGDFLSLLEDEEKKVEAEQEAPITIIDSSKPYPTKEDEIARNLDVPVSNVIRRCEEEALANGHENKGFLSFRNGFLPMLYPENSLPPKYKVWDDMGRHLNAMMSDLTLRPFIENELEVLSASKEDLEDRYLFRAALVLGMTAHGYWYCGPKEPKVLPPSLKEPWDEVNRRLGRKGSYLSGEDVQLYNFQYKTNQTKVVKGGSPFDAQADGYIIENLNMLQAMWNNKAEIVFHLAFCEMAKAAAPLLRLIAHAQDAVQQGDDDEVLEVIQSIAVCIEQIQKAFMKIIPDPNATNGIEPLVWAKTVAPVGVSFNKGMPSPSGLGTPFFHCLDMLFSRGKYSSTLGKDSLGAREFFPSNWTAVINAIPHISVHVYVSSSDNEELHNAWSHAINVYASWNGMLGKHLQKTYNFLELAFKTGREKTLGGFQGGFSDRMWDRVMDMLDVAREERLTAKNATLKLPVARLNSFEGRGDIVSLSYKLPHDAFLWQPGDTVSVWPANCTESITSILLALGATGDEMVELSEEWRLHLKQVVPMGMKVGNRSAQTQLRHILQFSQLNPVPEETISFLSTLVPAYKIKGYQDDQFDLPELLGLIKMLFGDLFRLDDNGSMPELKLEGAEKLYDQFSGNAATEPLVEDIVSILHAIGVDDIPVFSGRAAHLDEFVAKVYPKFQNRLKRNLGSRSVASAVDIFRPIKPRQYSIANCRNSENRELKLIVKKLTYVKKPSKGSMDMSNDWRSHNRQQYLAQKYFKRWKTKALCKGGDVFNPRASFSIIDVIKADPWFSQSERLVYGVASNYLGRLHDLMFTVESNTSFHAPSSDKPLVMFAASSGISPFIGFLEDRIAKSCSAETILLWSIPYVKDCMHVLKDIENIVEGSNSEMKLNIFVNITRESVCPVFNTDTNKFTLESRPQCRVTEFIGRNIKLRKTLQGLLLPEKYNGSGGFTYLCGSARFVSSTLDVVSELLSDMSLFDDPGARHAFASDSYGKLSKKWLVQELQSDQKIVYEAFNDNSPRDIPSISISKLVTMNDPRHKQFLSIYDQVYDVTDFVHPGGQRILQSYWGMDCTVAWEAVRHHKSQSLNAKLETLHIGQLATPSFPTWPLLKLDNNTTADLNGVFGQCRKLMFNIVEIENSASMEYALDVLHIAGTQDAKALTPMKFQMIFQAHRRFVFSHLVSLTNAVAQTSRYQNALRCPQDISFADQDFFIQVPTVEDQSKPVILEEVAGYVEMMVSCDLFVAACHQIEGLYKGSKIIDYLTSSIYTLKRYDMELLRDLKQSMKLLMIYFEERDSQELSLPNLYYEMKRVINIMRMDMTYYVAKVSSELVIGELWQMMDVTPDDLSSFMANNSLGDRPVKDSRSEAGWQSGVKK